MLDRYALQLQLLARGTDQVLAVSDLLRRKTEQGIFRPAEILVVFRELHVPAPRNIHAVLGRLESQKLVLKHGIGAYALTPVGVQKVQELSLDVAANLNEGGSKAGSTFAHTDHTVIPAWAAPPRWAAGIARLLERHPFDTNVFCMTRFPSEGTTPDPVTKAIGAARDTLAGFGLTLHLATDGIVEDDLLGNVGAYMWACRYGLGIVENRAKKGINYNAVIELGGMTLTGRRCAILKDITAPSLPTDLAGQIYKSVDLDELGSITRTVAHWAENDLHLPRVA